MVNPCLALPTLIGLPQNAARSAIADEAVAVDPAVSLFAMLLGRVSQTTDAPVDEHMEPLAESETSTLPNDALIPIAGPSSPIPAVMTGVFCGPVPPGPAVGPSYASAPAQAPAPLPAAALMSTPQLSTAHPATNPYRQASASALPSTLDTAAQAPIPALPHVLQSPEEAGDRIILDDPIALQISSLTISSLLETNNLARTTKDVPVGSVLLDLFGEPGPLPVTLGSTCVPSTASGTSPQTLPKAETISLLDCRSDAWLDQLSRDIEATAQLGGSCTSSSHPKRSVESMSPLKQDQKAW